MPLLIAIGVVAAAVMIGAAIHQKRLLKNKGVTKDEFVQEFANSGVAAEIAAAVYDYFQRESTTASFQVSPEFSLTTVFRKSHEDVDDDVREILSALRLRLPPESVLRRWPRPLSTVRDVVEWIRWISERQSSIQETT
jgi:hypothetical protein